MESTFENQTIKIPEQKIIGQDIKVEADWSSACFFYALLIMQDVIKSIQIYDLNFDDIQGDKYMVELGNLFGIETIFSKNGVWIKKVSEANPPLEIRLEDYPDLAIPLITACAFKFPNITFLGLEHLKHKESNRIEALRINLEKFGIALKENKGTISLKIISLLSTDKTVQIETFKDHRIAMSFALTAVWGIASH